ncbi:hypothetical protein IAT40_001056 [Kwoniella sp. CBS 6097]
MSTSFHPLRQRANTSTTYLPSFPRRDGPTFSSSTPPPPFTGGWRAGEVQRKWFLLVEYGEDLVRERSHSKPMQRKEEAEDRCLLIILQPTLHQQLVLLLPQLHLPSPQGLSLHLIIPSTYTDSRSGPLASLSSADHVRVQRSLTPAISENVWPAFFASHLSSSYQAQPQAQTQSHLSGLEGLPIAARLILRVRVDKVKGGAKWYEPWKSGDDGLAWFGRDVAQNESNHSETSTMRPSDSKDDERADTDADADADAVFSVSFEDEKRVDPPPTINKPFHNSAKVATIAGTTIASSVIPRKSSASATASAPSPISNDHIHHSVSAQSSPLCMSSVPYSPITSPPHPEALATQPFLQQLTLKLALLDKSSSRSDAGFGSCSEKSSGSTRRRKDPGLTIHIPSTPTSGERMPWADLGSTMYSAGTSWGPPDTPEGWDDSPSSRARDSNHDSMRDSYSKQQSKDGLGLLSIRPVTGTGTGTGSVVPTASVFEFDSINLNSAVAMSAQTNSSQYSSSSSEQGPGSAVVSARSAQSAIFEHDHDHEHHVRMNVNTDVNDSFIQPSLETLVDAPESYAAANPASDDNDNVLPDSMVEGRTDLRPVGDWTFLPRGPITPTPWKFGWSYQGDTIPLNSDELSPETIGGLQREQREFDATMNANSTIRDQIEPNSSEEQGISPPSIRSPLYSPSNHSVSSAFSPIAHQPHPLDLTHPLHRFPSRIPGFLFPDQLSPISPLVLPNGHLSPLSLKLASRSPHSPLTPSKLSAASAGSGSDVSFSFFDDDHDSSEMVAYGYEDENYLDPVEYEGGSELSRETTSGSGSWFGGGGGGRRVSLGGLEVIDELSPLSSEAESEDDLDNQVHGDSRDRRAADDGKEAIIDSVPVKLGSVTYPELIIYPAKTHLAVLREQETPSSESYIGEAVALPSNQNLDHSGTRTVSYQTLKLLPVGEIDKSSQACLPISLCSFIYPQIVIYPGSRTPQFCYPHIIIYPSVRLPASSRFAGFALERVRFRLDSRIVHL